MYKLKSIWLCFILVAFSSCNKKVESQHESGSSKAVALNESIRPYFRCKAEHPKYPISIVQWISWIDGNTPRSRFRLDLADKDWNIRSFDSTSNPSSPEPGRLIFQFARGGDKVDYIFTSGLYGTVEISENGTPIERVNCTKADDGDFVSPSEKIRDYTQRLGQSAWCLHVLVEKTVAQYVFHPDGRYEVKTCEWDEKPQRETSASVGSWALDKNLKLIIQHGGATVHYDRIYVPRNLSQETEFQRYLTMFRNGESSGVLWNACQPCWK